MDVEIQRTRLTEKYGFSPTVETQGEVTRFLDPHGEIVAVIRPMSIYTVWADATPYISARMGLGDANAAVGEINGRGELSTLQDAIRVLETVVPLGHRKEFDQENRMIKFRDPDGALLAVIRWQSKERCIEFLTPYTVKRRASGAIAVVPDQKRGDARYIDYIKRHTPPAGIRASPLIRNR